MQALDALRSRAEDELAAAETVEATESWYRDYLGRNGAITNFLRGLGDLPRAERPAAGRAGNELKKRLEAALHTRQEAIRQHEMEQTLAAEGVDVTLPGHKPNLGKIHPSNQTLREIAQIFGQMGFQVYDAPEVETDENNFGLLNIPAGHPARDMWDTFYTTTPGVILRTHTSPGQIHAMREYCPEPIRVILPGKCYRHEDVSARYDMMFHQVEGLVVGHNVTFSDLKGTLVNFANQMFRHANPPSRHGVGDVENGEGRKLRFRKSYFPFTEPSVEVDAGCVLCGAEGCRICKQTGWLEILGAGMVHPIVLQNGGYDPSVFSGFAFGMGPERIAMLKYGIDDIRYFFTNDVRFLERVG